MPTLRAAATRRARSASPQDSKERAGIAFPASMRGKRRAGGCSLRGSRARAPAHRGRERTIGRKLVRHAAAPAAAAAGGFSRPKLESWYRRPETQSWCGCRARRIGGVSKSPERTPGVGSREDADEAPSAAVASATLGAPCGGRALEPPRGRGSAPGPSAGGGPAAARRAAPGVPAGIPRDSGAPGARPRGAEPRECRRGPAALRGRGPARRRPGRTRRAAP